MILKNEERRTIWIAGVAGAAVLLGYYVGLPLWNKWADLGRNLEPKLRYVERIQERAAAQNALVARRDELAKKLGAVEGREGQAGGGPGAPGMPPGASGMPPGAPGTPPGAPGVKPNPLGAVPGAKTAPAAGPLPDAAPGVARVAPPAVAPAPDKPTPDKPATDKPATPVPDKSAPVATAAKVAPPSSPTTTLAAASSAVAAKSAGKPPAPPAPTAPKPEAKPPAATVAAYVERQAGMAGVRISSIMPVAPSLGFKEGKAFRPAAVQVTFEATAESLIKLFHALEKGERLIRVEQTEIRHDVKKGTAVSGSLRIVGYQSLAR